MDTDPTSSEISPIVHDENPRSMSFIEEAPNSRLQYATSSTRTTRAGSSTFFSAASNAHDVDESIYDSSIAMSSSPCKPATVPATAPSTPASAAHPESDPNIGLDTTIDSLLESNIPELSEGGRSDLLPARPLPYPIFPASSSFSLAQSLANSLSTPPSPQLTSTPILVPLSTFNPGSPQPLLLSRLTALPATALSVTGTPGLHATQTNAPLALSLISAHALAHTHTHARGRVLSTVNAHAVHATAHTDTSVDTGPTSTPAPVPVPLTTATATTAVAGAADAVASSAVGAVGARGRGMAPSVGMSVDSGAGGGVCRVSGSTCVNVCDSIGVVSMLPHTTASTAGSSTANVCTSADMRENRSATERVSLSVSDKVNATERRSTSDAVCEPDTRGADLSAVSALPTQAIVTGPALMPAGGALERQSLGAVLRDIRERERDWAERRTSAGSAAVSVVATTTTNTANAANANAAGAKDADVAVHETEEQVARAVSKLTEEQSVVDKKRESVDLKADVDVRVGLWSEERRLEPRGRERIDGGRDGCGEKMSSVGLAAGAGGGVAATRGADTAMVGEFVHDKGAVRIAAVVREGSVRPSVNREDSTQEAVEGESEECVAGVGCVEAGRDIKMGEQGRRRRQRLNKQPPEAEDEKHESEEEVGAVEKSRVCDVELDSERVRETVECRVGSRNEGDCECVEESLGKEACEEEEEDLEVEKPQEDASSLGWAPQITSLSSLIAADAARSPYNNTNPAYTIGVVHTLLMLPLHLERFLALGVVLCFDSFFHALLLGCKCVLVAPVGAVMLMWQWLQIWVWGEHAFDGTLHAQCLALSSSSMSSSHASSLVHKHKHHRTRAPSHPRTRTPVLSLLRTLDLRPSDIFRGLIYLTVLRLLLMVPVTSVYHYIRVQSTMKLYVVYNMSQIFERLLTSVGDDILEALYSLADERDVEQRVKEWDKHRDEDRVSSSASVAEHPCRPWFRTQHLQRVALMMIHAIVATIYLALHTALTLLQLVTLNVAINSQESALFVILQSNNFIELKSFVFKKYFHATLFQVVANDVVERFQLIVTLAVIALYNLAHLGFASLSARWLQHIWELAQFLLLCEVSVDAVKHAFMVKFNRLPLYYKAFSSLLWKDAVVGLTVGQVSVPEYVPITRRLGFSNDPLVLISLSSLGACVSASDAGWVAKAVLLCCVYLALWCAKVGTAALVAGMGSRHVRARGLCDPFTHIDIDNPDKVHNMQHNTQASTQRDTAKDVVNSYVANDSDGWAKNVNKEVAKDAQRDMCNALLASTGMSAAAHILPEHAPTTAAIPTSVDAAGRIPDTMLAPVGSPHRRARTSTASHAIERGSGSAPAGVVVGAVGASIVPVARLPHVNASHLGPDTISVAATTAASSIAATMASAGTTTVGDNASRDAARAVIASTAITAPCTAISSSVNTCSVAVSKSAGGKGVNAIATTITASQPSAAEQAMVTKDLASFYAFNSGPPAMKGAGKEGVKEEKKKPTPLPIEAVVRYGMYANKIPM